VILFLSVLDVEGDESGLECSHQYFLAFDYLPACLLFICSEYLIDGVVAGDNEPLIVKWYSSTFNFSCEAVAVGPEL